MQILQRTLFLKVHTANLRYGFENEFYTCLFGFNSQLLHFVFEITISEEIYEYSRIIEK